MSDKEKAAENVQKFFDSCPDIEGFQVFDHSKEEDGHAGLHIKWSRKGKGFGECYILVDKKGKVTIDSEAMGRPFVLSLLAKMVKEAKIDTDPEEKKEAEKEKSK